MKDKIYWKRWLWLVALLAIGIKAFPSMPVKSVICDNIQYELTTYFDITDQTQKRYATVIGWASQHKPITSIVIPFQIIGPDNVVYNIKKIQNGAFKDSPNLKYVSLKCKEVMDVPEDAFGGNTHLEILDLREINEGWNLYRHIKTNYLLVQSGTYSIYKTLPEWSDVDIIDDCRNPDLQEKIRPAGVASYIFSNRPAQRWERSTDKGLTWEIIPNTRSFYIEASPEAGECRYRILDKNGMYHPVVTILYRDTK